MGFSCFVLMAGGLAVNMIVLAYEPISLSKRRLRLRSYKKKAKKDIPAVKSLFKASGFHKRRVHKAQLSKEKIANVLAEVHRFKSEQ